MKSSVNEDASLPSAIETLAASQATLAAVASRANELGAMITSDAAQTLAVHSAASAAAANLSAENIASLTQGNPAGAITTGGGGLSE